MRRIKRNIIFVLLLVAASVSAQKERVTIRLSLDSLYDSTDAASGCYSLSICDADIVPPDSINPNAMAELLLCSELRGEIESPNYYFSGSPKAMSDLDLLMMTQGWRRYELKDILHISRHPVPNIAPSQSSTRRRRTLPFNPRCIECI